MRSYRIEITGTMPLLMHADDIEWADRMDAWKVNPNHQGTSKAGDDRSPAFRWIGSLYHNGETLVIPTENIMRALMEGGAMVPTGKGKKTFKAQSQSGIMPRSIGWPLILNGAPVPFEPIAELMEISDFAMHKEIVAGLGFSLFVKRAKINTSKHVRVRPRFETWATQGELVVTDEEITTDILKSILTCAGLYKGLCDWRPGSKTPGTFGMFTAKVQQL